MKRYRRWTPFGILGGIILITLLLFVTPLVRAEGPSIFPTDAGIMGEDWRLPEGETYEGDVAVIGGNAYVEKGAVLNGDLAVVGGNAIISGTVNGDVAVVGGNLEIRGNGTIHGNAGVTGGRILRDSTAVVTGKIAETGVVNIPGMLPSSLWKEMFHMRGGASEISVPPPGSPEWVVYYLWRLITGILGAFITALVLGAIAAVIESVWPESTTNVMQTLVYAPVASFFIGLAVLVAVIILGVLLLITLCLSPIGALLLLGLLAAWLLGWTAMGRIVGQHVWTALNLNNKETVLSTALGAFLLAVLSSIPCIGHLFGLIIGSVGLGAVVLSSFGTQIPHRGKSTSTSALPPTE